MLLINGLRIHQFFLKILLTASFWAARKSDECSRMTEEMSVERKRAGKKNEAVKMHRPEEVKGASVHITACSGEVWREERHWQGAMQCDEIANFVDYKKEAAFSVVVEHELPRGKQPHKSPLLQFVVDSRQNRAVQCQFNQRYCKNSPHF